MRLTTTTLVTILAASSVRAVPVEVESNGESQLATRDLIKSLERRNDEISQSLDELAALKEKRDSMSSELSKREYELVTTLLSALNDTGLVPKVLSYVVHNPKLSSIAVDVLVQVIKLGSVELPTLFQALDKSNVIPNTIESLISDCQFYVDLFEVAKSLISDLVEKVEELIKKGISSLTEGIDSTTSGSSTSTQSAASSTSLSSSLLKRDDSNSDLTETDLTDRDLSDIIANILESLSNSGLLVSLIKTILTDSAYISFGADLIKDLIEQKAISLDQVIDALKSSNLVSDLLKQILTVDNFKTIATNAFAAFSGNCGNATSVLPSSIIPTHGTTMSVATQTSSTTPTGAPANPCTRKRKRRYFLY